VAVEALPRGLVRRRELRKIQFSGRSSFTISLPKRWVLGLGLKAGDAVSLILQPDSSLLLVPAAGPRQEPREEVALHVSQGEPAPAVIRRLIASYLLGYNFIRLLSSRGDLSLSIREAVKDAVRRYLIGTEVVSESSNSIALQVLLSYPQLDLKTVIRRMALIASSMHREALRALLSMDREAALAVLRTDDDVDRFGLYATRQLNIALKQEAALPELGLSSNRDCLDYRLIVKSVERIADHACKIAFAARELEEPLEQEVRNGIGELSEMALRLFEEAIRSLFEADYPAAEGVVQASARVAEAEGRLLSRARSLMPSLPGAVPLVLEALRRTAEYSADIAELVINLTLQARVPGPGHGQGPEGA
jgi:phosphate uptake regulator